MFNDALYNMLRKCLSDVATPDIAFAWRCFTFDSTTKNILGLPTSSRPGLFRFVTKSIQVYVDENTVGI